LVIPDVFLMLAAVDFDNQATLHADEVDDIGADRVLPTKLHSDRAMRPEVTPETPLCVGRIGSQCARELL
jgi:hypothetical protein